MTVARDPKEAGKLLRELRGDRTRTSVAFTLGCSVSALEAYENGIRVPRDEMKCRIADFYDMKVQSIWYCTDE